MNRCTLLTLAMVGLIPALLSGCSKPAEEAEEIVRPVRMLTITTLIGG